MSTFNPPCLPQRRPAQKDAPIGIFDSGVGGLSVYLHLQKLLPNERFIYYADTKNLPYGNKDADTIRSLTANATDWLINQGVKMVVVACNSASAYSLDFLRQQHTCPIVGLVPAIKPACFMSQSRKIAVLATEATLNGNSVNDIIHQYANPQGIEVTKKFMSNLVPWVENGMPKNDAAAHQLLAFIKDLHDNRTDVLVLGCTHYPFFKEFLTAHIHRHNYTISVIDSGEAIAKRVQSLLLGHQIQNPTKQANTALQFYSSQKLDTQLLVNKITTFTKTAIDFL